MTSEIQRMQAIVTGIVRVSDKIRALDKAGYPRAEIARFLGKRYQHVRNVLVGDQTVGRSLPTRKKVDMPSILPATPGIGRATKVVLDSDGRITIPPSFRDLLGLREGDILLAKVVDEDVHLVTARSAIRRVQETFAPYRSSSGDEVDEFLADRPAMWGEDDGSK